jgi:hypothetical protein
VAGSEIGVVVTVGMTTSVKAEVVGTGLRGGLRDVPQAETCAMKRVSPKMLKILFFMVAPSLSLSRQHDR